MDDHRADWPEAGRLLNALLDRYRGLRTKTALLGLLAAACGVTIRQVRRYLNGDRMPPGRSECVAGWLKEGLGASRAEIVAWLEVTDHPRPGPLVARLFDGHGSGRARGRPPVRSLPRLGSRLWGPFLGRAVELAWAARWADQQRQPIALLWGFGGNGKSALQLRIGELFVDGPRCPLRHPYQGVVWISANDLPLGRLNLLDVLRAGLAAFGVASPETLATAAPDWITATARQLLEQERVLVLVDNFESVAPAHQHDILEFFGWLQGTSQLLISTRHDFDTEELRAVAHSVIPVGGLRPEDSDQLIQDYLVVTQPDAEVPALTVAQRAALAEAMANNPKALIAALGLVIGAGLPLADLLAAVRAGDPEAEEIFAVVIGQAWDEVLDDGARRVLLAKALFSQPVGRGDLGRVAGVTDEALGRALRTLHTISFFERPLPDDPRVRTHPLAQDFARRRWHDPANAALATELATRWWTDYAPGVVARARATSYGALQAQSALDDDITSVLEQIAAQVQTGSPWARTAADLFAARRGLGHALRQVGRWDDVVRVADLVLAHAIEWRNARLIGMCAIKLLAEVHRGRSRLDLAVTYLSRATDLNADLDDPWLTATISRERAAQHRRQGHFRATKEALEGALHIYEDLGNPADIASTLHEIAGTIIELVSADLGATDPNWSMRAEWGEVERLFQQGEYYWELDNAQDASPRFYQTDVRAWHGVIARLQNDLPRARQLFEGCLGQFQSLLSEARLRRELALVEHLAGNRELAHAYEEDGLRLFRQVGAAPYPPHNCYRVIDQLKQEGRW